MPLTSTTIPIRKDEMKIRESLTHGGAAETEGRTLTFLANSGKKMSNGLTVDLATLKAPLIDGTLKPVDKLTESDRLSLPLLIDHEPSIEAQAGTINRLWLTDAGLMAEAKLSEVDNGERVRRLAADGCLTNSFSITVEFSERPGKDGIIHDSELIEISVVYRGADPKAAFTSINKRNGDPMDPNLMNKLARTVAEFKLTPDEAANLTSSVTDIMQDAVDDITEAVTDQTDGQSARKPLRKSRYSPPTSVRLSSSIRATVPPSSPVSPPSPTPARRGSTPRTPWQLSNAPSSTTIIRASKRSTSSGPTPCPATWPTPPPSA